METKHNSLGMAMAHAKCPRCRQGDMFQYKWWQVTKFLKFNKECSACNFRFEREPGFFDGAMYVSYAMSVAMTLTSWFVLYFIVGDPPFKVYIITIIILNIVLLPFLFRYSRVIFIYAFGGIKYEKQLNKEK
ncbi:MAG: DUF983 domain-containing protein [Cyclobacteriaceae bacterium]|nr:DUF983 domain-containing protein [Cyclobacteriaceae bacterium]